MTTPQTQTSVCEDGTLPIYLTLFTGIVALFVAKARAGTPPADQEYYATTSIGKWLERNLVFPWVPKSKGRMILWLFCTYFAMTITMATTRRDEGQWMLKFIAQMWIPNKISSLLGCAPYNTTALVYPLNGVANLGAGEDPLEYNPDIDLAIWLHLTCGILWLTLGSVQIYMARIWSWDAHKAFGRYLALVAFVGHMAGASHMLWVNIAHDTLLSSAMLSTDIFTSSIYIIAGILVIRAENENGKKTHSIFMFFGFIHGVMGSGTIRFVSWVFWIIGIFLDPPYRRLVDRTYCQNNSFEEGLHMASSEQCAFSYTLNLAFVIMMTIWVKLVFLKLPEYGNLENKGAIQKLVRSELEGQYKLIRNAFIILLPLTMLKQNDVIWDHVPGILKSFLEPFKLGAWDIAVELFFIFLTIQDTVYSRVLPLLELVQIPETIKNGSAAPKKKSS